MRAYRSIVGILASIALVAGCAAGDLNAESIGLELGTGGFAVDYADCSEFLGFLPVPFEQVRPRVPDAFDVTQDDQGRAEILVRVFACAEIAVDGHPPRPGSFSHIGVRTSGTGDVNFALLWGTTDHAELAASYRAAGVPARHVQNQEYNLLEDDSGAVNAVDIHVPLPASPSFTVTGAIADPPPDAAPSGLIASWYWLGQHGEVLMESSFDAVTFGLGDTTLETFGDSELAAVIGGASTGFALVLRGLFATTHTDVIVTAP